MPATEEPNLKTPHMLGAQIAMFCLDPAEAPSWDTSLAHCPGATFFHSAAWARVLKSAYGYKSVYFATLNGSALGSLLPVMEVSSWLTGRRGIALPFSDESAPLVPNAQSFNDLREAALAHGKRRGWKYLECRGGRNLFGNVPAAESFFGHRLRSGEERKCPFRQPRKLDPPGNPQSRTSQPRNRVLPRSGIGQNLPPPALPYATSPRRSAPAVPFLCQHPAARFGTKPRLAGPRALQRYSGRRSGLFSFWKHCNI